VDLKTGRFDGGWTVEGAVPFKSLRYQPGTSQTWGFNASRVKRSKNEISMLSPAPRAQGAQGVEQTAYAAQLLGIEAPAQHVSVDLKPYMTSSLSSDMNVNPRVSNHGRAAVGFDAKYAVTRNLAADVTVNTDFAQVEADQQQVNLTRFSLFFPEKREFFLENQGTFSFGGVAVGSLNAGTSDAPILFYSRRIGLNAGREVPIEAGGRLTGRAGRYSIGAINIQSGEEDASGALATNFTVARVKRDLLGRSSIGAIVTNRSVAAAGTGRNLATGWTARSSFFKNLQINTYWARTESDQPLGPHGDDTSLSRAAGLHGGSLRPAARTPRHRRLRSTRKWVSCARWTCSATSRRPASARARAAAAPSASTSTRPRWTTSRTARDVSRRGTATGEFALDFKNADRVGVLFTNEYEYLPAPFRIGGGLTLPVGSYDFDTARLNYNMGQQRAVSANLSVDYGTFYDGHKTTLSVARGRVPVHHQFSFEPPTRTTSAAVGGRFTTHLAGSRVTYTMTPLMFVSALLQYNSGTDAVSTNAGCGGSTSPAASSSSSTTRSAIRSRRASPP
jgi:hypothetical protein